MRKMSFINNEYYHLYNRGVDKRRIFSDANDLKRFIQSMEEFNVIDPIGSIYEHTYKRKTKMQQKKKERSHTNAEKLVEITCYCLNPNHYHFLLMQTSDRGIEKFMHRLSTGYTNYFNEKNKRIGSLFQGPYKAVHIETNQQLLHVSAYINLNNRVHHIKNQLVRSSWDEYLGIEKGFCQKDIILGQYKNSINYQEFALSALEDIQERKNLQKNLLEFER